MKEVLHLEGALRGCRSLVQDARAEIDSGQRLERAGFAQLVEGTRMTLDDVLARILERDWYLTADGALRLGLVSRVVRAVAHRPCSPIRRCNRDDVVRELKIGPELPRANPNGYRRNPAG